MLLQHFLFFLTQMKKNPLQETQVQPATCFCNIQSRQKNGEHELVCMLGYDAAQRLQQLCLCAKSVHVRNLLQRHVAIVAEPV
jgi:hypothetical protein